MRARSISRLVPFTRVVVHGASMVPALLPGDRVLVRRTSGVDVGDLAVVPDPRHPARVLVKRVAAADRTSVTLVGDNPDASTDSRTFGTVPRRTVVGRAIYRYAPAGRTGRL